MLLIFIAGTDIVLCLGCYCYSVIDDEDDDDDDEEEDCGSCYFVVLKSGYECESRRLLVSTPMV